MEAVWVIPGLTAHPDHLADHTHLLTHFEVVKTEGMLDPQLQKKTTKGINMDRPTIARWAFIVGLALAVIIALVTNIDEWAVWIMIVLALYAGWEFVSEDQEHHFFLVAISLVFFSQTLADLPSIGEPLTALLTSLSTFFGVMVVALVVRNIIGWVTGNPISSK
jgi:hypothetical protein